MRTVDTLAKQHGTYPHARIVIGGTDYTNRCRSLEISESHDERGREASITLTHALGQPKITIDAMQPVEIYVGVTSAPNQTPSWNLVFEGYTGDEISTDYQASREGELRLNCRDKRKKLMDYFITDELKYHYPDGISLVDLLQTILNDTIGGITLYVIHDPLFLVHTYIIKEVSLWEALQNAVEPTGYDLRYRFYGGSFQLCLADPWKVGGSDSISHFRTLAISKTDATVRNKVKIVYQDRSTHEIREVIAEDAASQAKYGVRAMKIQEGASSLIDTETEATEFADRILQDLKGITPNAAAEVRNLVWYLEPFDSVTLDSGNPQVPTLIIKGITKISWQLELGHSATTRFEGADDRVVSATARHLKNERRGAGAWDDKLDQDSRTTGTKDTVKPRTPANLVAESAHAGIVVTWDKVTLDEYDRILEDLAKYKVYLRELQPFAFDEATGEGSAIFGINELGYLKFGLTLLEEWTDFETQPADETYIVDVTNFSFD